MYFEIMQIADKSIKPSNDSLFVLPSDLRNQES